MWMFRKLLQVLKSRSIGTNEKQNFIKHTRIGSLPTWTVIGNYDGKIQEYRLFPKHTFLKSSSRMWLLDKCFHETALILINEKTWYWSNSRNSTA